MTSEHCVQNKNEILSRRNFTSVCELVSTIVDRTVIWCSHVDMWTNHYIENVCVCAWWMRCTYCEYEVIWITYIHSAPVIFFFFFLFYRRRDIVSKSVEWIYLARKSRVKRLDENLRFIMIYGAVHNLTFSYFILADTFRCVSINNWKTKEKKNLICDEIGCFNQLKSNLSPWILFWLSEFTVIVSSVKLYNASHTHTVQRPYNKNKRNIWKKKKAKL